MAGKRVSVNVDHLIKEYVGGKSIRKCAQEFGVSTLVVSSRLKEAGVLRSQSDAAKLRLSDPTQHPRWTSLDSNDIVSAYLAGESSPQIATRVGVSSNVIDRRLKDAGIPLRSHSEATATRLSRTTDEYRKRTTKKAQEARRGQTDAGEVKAKRAKTHERLLDLVGRGEQELSQMLKDRGFTPIPQLAVDGYNLDLGVWPVAVEVESSNRSPTNYPPTRKRTMHLLNRGWRVLIVWGFPEAGAADYVVSYLEFADRNPSSPCEYRVIRSAGEVVSQGGFDADQWTLIERLV